LPFSFSIRPAALSDRFSPLAPVARFWRELGKERLFEHKLNEDPREFLPLVFIQFEVYTYTGLSPSLSNCSLLACLDPGKLRELKLRFAKELLRNFGLALSFAKVSFNNSVV
jgi:hypothetical protein